MLMYHPDTKSYCIVRGVDFLNLTVDQNLTFVRLVESIGDAHGGGFAGAVLADDGMDRAGRNLDVHVVVSQHVPEAFGYVSQF
jgi:hypothetical protein